MRLPILALCPEFRPPKINFATCERKWVTMVNIVSTRECCGDQPSSSSERDRAGSETAKARRVAPQEFPKSSEMPHFPSRWRELIRLSSIEDKRKQPIPCESTPIPKASSCRFPSWKTSTSGALSRQFVRFPDRPSHLPKPVRE